MLLQHKPLSAALLIVVRFSLQYPPIPIYEDWMSPWTNVSTLKTLCEREDQVKRENVWLVALQYPGVLLIQAPAGKGTWQLPAGNRLKHS